MGFITRMIFLSTERSTRFLNQTFIPLISPVTFIGLIYTILVMFAYQGHHILHNIGKVFRVMVPLVLYFCIMWSVTFFGIWWVKKRVLKKNGGKNTSNKWSYEMAVVQAFTAGSNNFVSHLCFTYTRAARLTSHPGRT